jgi:hypothetical protein
MNYISRLSLGEAGNKPIQRIRVTVSAVTHPRACYFGLRKQPKTAEKRPAHKRIGESPRPVAPTALSRLMRNSARKS